MPEYTTVTFGAEIQSEWPNAKALAERMHNINHNYLNIFTPPSEDDNNTQLKPAVTAEDFENIFAAWELEGASEERHRRTGNSFLDRNLLALAGLVAENFSCKKENISLQIEKADDKFKSICRKKEDGKVIITVNHYASEAQYYDANARKKIDRPSSEAFKNKEIKSVRMLAKKENNGEMKRTRLKSSNDNGIIKEQFNCKEYMPLLSTTFVFKPTFNILESGTSYLHHLSLVELKVEKNDKIINTPVPHAVSTVQAINNQNLEFNNTKLRFENIALKDKNENLENQAEKTAKLYEEMSLNYRRQQGEIALLKAALANSQEMNEGNKVLLNEKDEKIGVLNNEMTCLKSQLQEQSETILNKAHLIDEKDKKIQSLELEKNNLETKNTGLYDAISELKAKVTSLERELRRTADIVRVRDRQAKVVSKKITEMQQQKKADKKKIKRLEKVIKLLRAKNKILIKFVKAVSNKTGQYLRQSHQRSEKMWEALQNVLYRNGGYDLLESLKKGAASLLRFFKIRSSAKPQTFADFELPNELNQVSNILERQAESDGKLDEILNGLYTNTPILNHPNQRRNAASPKGASASNNRLGQKRRSSI